MSHKTFLMDTVCSFVCSAPSLMKVYGSTSEQGGWFGCGWDGSCTLLPLRQIGVYLYHSVIYSPEHCFGE